MKTRLTLGLSFLLAACAAQQTTSTPPPEPAVAEVAAVLPLAPPQDPVQVAEQAIRAGDLQRDIAVLSSDEFEGRLPGTPGEEKTVAYIQQQFQALGLAPGNPDGSYMQAVPLVGIDGTPTLSLKAGGKTLPMSFRKDYVATTSRFLPAVTVKDSELVFVGYGIQAPEYGWDDYKGLDLRGKTIVMLINDPPVADPADPGKLDEQTFKGRAMTYYGRWTYKFEIASKLGAAAAIIVHETEPAAYPWAVVENSWTGEQFDLAAKDGNAGRVPVQAWMTVDKARALFSAAGKNYDDAKQAALSRDFQPMRLKARASFTIRNKVREVNSHNVVALLPGSDPERAKELLIYTAHWDHLGRDTTLSGDQIFNGAVDNASGVAGLLAIARAYKALPMAPARPVLFLAVTAEEQGLLGSRHYASNPLYPVAKTLAVINMDALSPYGPTKDVPVIGYGQNSLEDALAPLVAARGRVITPDPHPERGSYFRSDHFEFAKVGVPAIDVGNGVQVLGKPDGWGETKMREFTALRYHKPSDEMQPDWDYSGMTAHLGLLFELGLSIDQNPVWPSWKPGSEFRAAREASLKH